VCLSLSRESAIPLSQKAKFSQWLFWQKRYLDLNVSQLISRECLCALDHCAPVKIVGHTLTIVCRLDVLCWVVDTVHNNFGKMCYVHESLELLRAARLNVRLVDRRHTTKPWFHAHDEPQGIVALFMDPAVGNSQKLGEQLVLAPQVVISLFRNRRQLYVQHCTEGCGCPGMLAGVHHLCSVYSFVWRTLLVFAAIATSAAADAMNSERHENQKKVIISVIFVAARASAHASHEGVTGLKHRRIRTAARVG
jgi:hypothetical protein